MASIDQFIIPQGWNVTSWHVQHINGTGSVPKNGFKKDNTLTIVPSVTEEVCNLFWPNDLGEPSSILDLPFHKAAGRLHSPLIPVSFGEKSSSFDVTVFIREETGQLIGEFTGPESDGNKGTFIAEANPPVDGKPA